ncbi:YceD family protein [Bartonella raoultii]|uniref:YceD family protein n=1 Tax=Bartonella raoultii TaxID=1457020 RepID=UPI001ABB47B4|nr:YceD family protein [Bartonella raoultii]
MNAQNIHQMTFALTYPVSVRSLPVKGTRVYICANQRECAHLAKNHALVEVKSCEGKFHIFPWKKRGVRIKGLLQARIIQLCVITLEPLENILHEKIEVVFVPEDSNLLKPNILEDTGELFLDAEGQDTPEVFSGDKIDIGAIMEEFFELSINHYPRKEGVKMRVMQNGEKSEQKLSPFSVLKNWK